MHGAWADGTRTRVLVPVRMGASILAWKADGSTDDAKTIRFRSRTVQPFAHQPPCRGENESSPPSSPRQAGRFQPESVVVILGVMYPHVLPPPDEGSQLDLPLPHLGGNTGRQSGDVIFYDPLSINSHGSDAPLAPKHIKKYPAAGYVNRAEARKAVARDLALLSQQKRGQSQLQSCSDTTETFSD
jgi:hypothetical protein